MTTHSTGNRFHLMMLAGCLIALVGYGVRAAFGIFVEPWSDARGHGVEAFALALAIQNIVWGLGQPFAGVLVDRFGPARVMIAGGLMYALGTLLTAYATTEATVYLTAGVLCGLGMSGGSYVTVVSVLGRLAPEQQRSWALGLATAAGSLGQFMVVPLGQALIDGFGWISAIMMLGFALGAVALCAAVFIGADQSTEGEQPSVSVPDVLASALRHPSFLLLTAGFFVCGFQLAFISVHLPAYLTGLGFSATTAAWGIGVIGLANVAGAYFGGIAGSYVSRRWLLSGLYAGRAIAMAAFVLLPPSLGTLMIFCATLGLLWLSTVPLTSGLVALMFGPRYLAVLFGIVFFGHQVGSFFGAWLGGYVFAEAGSYSLMWWISILLSIFAAVVHIPIAERTVPRFAAAT